LADGLAAGPAIAAGEDGGAAAAALVLVGWCWTGITAGIEAEYPAVLAAVGEVGEGLGRAGEVRGRVGDAVGRLARVATAAGAVALGWPPGSSTAPAKVSGRRGPSEVAMAATVTAHTAVAAADNHSAGPWTAGMPEWCHAPAVKVCNESR
jgi:hypothetical protein